MNARYLIEVWSKGALVIRSEVSDSVEMTVTKARTLYKALGLTFTVFVQRDGVNYCEYEWARLLENHPEIVRDWVEARDLKAGDKVRIGLQVAPVTYANHDRESEGVTLLSINDSPIFETNPDAPYTLAK